VEELETEKIVSFDRKHDIQAALIFKKFKGIFNK